MRKNNINLRVLFIMLLSIVMINAQAQTGLNFQGVARTSNNVILASQAITIKLSILQGSATGTADYSETRKVTTNAQGLFTAVIGDTGAISTLGNFTTINWKITPKFLKIEMDAAAGTNFITMGTTQFQYVAYAQFANSVDAENITGIVPVARGGTGANSLSALKTTMTLDKVNNTADTEKPISTKTQTVLDLKLNAADTIKYTKQTYADSSLLTKLKISDTAAMLSSRIARDTISLSNRINLKANTTDVTTSLSLKENASNKSSAADLGGVSPSDILFPTQKAVKDYVNANASSGSVADGGITMIKLADGAVTDAKINTVSGSKVIGNIVGNAETANTAIIAGTASTSTKLAKARNINGVAFDGSGDITITAIVDAGTLIGTTLNTIITGSSLTSVGILENLTVTKPIVGSITGNAATATTATSSGTATTTSGNAGTATKLATARNINGVAFDGSGDITITAAADAGTLTGTTLKSTITGSSLTSVGILVAGSVSYSLLTGTVPIWNQNTTGNAATANTATTAGNITATTNTTLTSLSSLATVGTITAGVWSGTAIALANGGTGATSPAAARTNLGLAIGTDVLAYRTFGTAANSSTTDFVAANASISGATKTKLTYDAKGLVTAGADATTADIAPSTDRNYVTDAQKSGVLSNTSGINTGDETGSTIKSKLSITTLSGSNTGDQLLPTLVSLGAVSNARTITINGSTLDLSADRSFTVSSGLTLTDLQTANVKAQTFELTQPSSITSTSTTTLDLSTGNILQVVLTGSTTLAFVNPKIGTYIIKIKQDATGNRTLNFPTIKWADAAVPTITPTANAVDLITLIYDGIDYYGSCLQNF